MALDLVATLVQLPKQGTFVSLKINNVLLHVTNLLGAHPWNNFLQLHVVSVFEWILKTPRLTAKERVALLSQSKITNCLATLGLQARYKHESGNSTRNGYMGCVVKLANMIKKVNEADNLEAQEEGAEVFTKEWKAFLDGEVTKSNKADSTTLGGASKNFNNSDSEEEPAAHFDDNMDAIMGRFTAFNTAMNLGNSASFDKEENEQEDIVEQAHEIEELVEEKIYHECETTIPTTDESSDPEFFSSAYWTNKNDVSEDELDAMLADYD